MLPSKFGVNWPYDSGKEAKKYIFKMAAMAAILDFQSARFSLYLIYKLPQCFLACLEATGLSVQERFPIGTILGIFVLQVTLMLPTKYRVNWPRGVGGVGF